MVEKTLLQQHLETDHRQTAVSGYVKELVYGGIDGIITTFAVVAGFTGASTAIVGDGEIVIPVTVVLIFGLANLFADGFSMGVGDFLSSRAKKKLFEKEKQKEYEEIANQTQYEQDETIEILCNHGFSREDAQTVTQIYKKNPEFWVDFMMRYELDMAKPSDTPVVGAIVTFLAFIVFGVVPLLPYIFDIVVFSGRFAIASIFAAIALALLGFVRAKFTRERTILSVFEIVVLGMVAALVAYFVGTLFV